MRHHGPQQPQQQQHYHGIIVIGMVIIIIIVIIIVIVIVIVIVFIIIVIVIVIVIIIIVVVVVVVLAIVRDSGPQVVLVPGSEVVGCDPSRSPPSPAAAYPHTPRHDTMIFVTSYTKLHPVETAGPSDENQGVTESVGSSLSTSTCVVLRHACGLAAYPPVPGLSAPDAPLGAPPGTARPHFSTACSGLLYEPRGTGTKELNAVKEEREKNGL
eukprot:3512841-Rhodomonas_salina.1